MIKITSYFLIYERRIVPYDSIEISKQTLLNRVKMLINISLFKLAVKEVIKKT